MLKYMWDATFPYHYIKREQVLQKKAYNYYHI